MKFLNDKSDLVTSPRQYFCLSLLHPHLVPRIVCVLCQVSCSTLLLVLSLPLPLGHGASGPLYLSCIIGFSPWIFLSAYKGGHGSSFKRLSFLPIGTTVPFFVLSHNWLKELSALSASTHSLIPSPVHSGPSPVVAHAETVLTEISMILLLSKPVGSFRGVCSIPFLLFCFSFITLQKFVRATVISLLCSLKLIICIMSLFILTCLTRGFNFIDFFLF